MKVEAIETIQLAEFANLLWVHVHANEGVIGLGETFFGADAVAAYVHESAAPYLLGKDPLRIDEHSHALRWTYVGFSGSGAEMRSLSAVDIALWDFFGQTTGQRFSSYWAALAVSGSAPTTPAPATVPATVMCRPDQIPVSGSRRVPWRRVPTRTSKPS